MNHFITVEEARDMVDRYRSQVGSLETPEFKGSLSFSETFDVSAFEAIIRQQGCKEIRAYFGMKSDNKVCLIFSGVDENGNDLGTVSRVNEEPVLVEYGKLCPPFCGTSTLF